MKRIDRLERRHLAAWLAWRARHLDAEAVAELRAILAAQARRIA